jgi:hypothetical protein
LFKYKRYQLRFGARQGYLKNEAMKVKAGTQCRKKEEVVPASWGGGRREAVTADVESE